ncbi:hypothetical protein ASPVEDRAFT_45650 [Aspergillus versicolor CBS 583.65]|uniref:Indoleamine 2,3-dioxygenase n=1 Tax=Aspergillus versicolor CBS 583.65 TaxID=1036611 RepID=A0A1L9PXK5_ASPVE|nr:uncharacterized protein ASPVEDRAFT_45650 [Aspergillus versicolor CBS 583.65]OJJ06248.1 hypothetical protein ASPVEDRAFT_45650 [Aspergillus versicolor CBS 583.65]
MSPLSELVSIQNQAYQNALSQIKLAPENEPVFEELKHLVNADGAGSWPPRATHGDTWPAVLRPYHDIYLEVAPYLSTENISTNNDVNTERRNSFRERVRKALHERVNLPSVKGILSATENEGNAAGITPPASFNGFSACIAYMRHAYRWALVPVVKVGQEKKIIDFPEELTLPWSFICRRYGVTSKGGNIMTNYLCNFDEQGRIIYEFNGALSELIRTAEYNFSYMFVATERFALPIYHEMATSIFHYNRGDKQACLVSLKAIVGQLPALLRVFSKTLIETQISTKVWMQYVQGPAAWGAGEIINGEYIEYDGLSGSHATFFRVADAFLALAPYFSEEGMRRYIPESQRKLFQAMQDHGFREKATEAGDELIGVEIENILKQLRLFRATHRARIHKYLTVPAPERLIMTAGRSVLESEQIPEIDTAMKHLDGILEKRLKLTK